MDIKMRARLAAYSKLDAIENVTPSVPLSAIDKLFTESAAERVSQGDIDNLFKNEELDIIVSKDYIDSLFDDNDSVTKVSYADIDKLFE